MALVYENDVDYKIFVVDYEAALRARRNLALGEALWDSRYVVPQYVLWIDDSTIEVLVDRKVSRTPTSIYSSDRDGVHITTRAISSFSKNEVCGASESDEIPVVPASRH